MEAKCGGIQSLLEELSIIESCKHTAMHVKIELPKGRKKAVADDVGVTAQYK